MIVKWAEALTHWLRENEADAVALFHKDDAFPQLQQALFEASRKHTLAVNGSFDCAIHNPEAPAPADTGEGA